MIIPLITHVLMSLVFYSIPNITRAEILFGVVLPADFRSRPEGRRAIRQFRFAVLLLSSRASLRDFDISKNAASAGEVPRAPC